MFSKVLVANRGEIAVRVMRACDELGVRTVAVYSDADTDAGHVCDADEAYTVGPARAAESYLDGRAIVDAARRAGADAIHPGYGFLAENADFARRVEDSEVTWVGPSSDAMERLGEKTRARSAMRAADVPIVPGTTDPVEEPAEIADFAVEHGYPVAIKAEGGGGGRGMKVVHEEDEIEDAFESARREGEAYFDNPSVYVERFLDGPRHIEVQIVGDEHGNVRHLGERDCSLQRRHQKIVEEAPSPVLGDDLRERITEAARRGADEAGYTNAGTMEFLVPTDDEGYPVGDDGPGEPFYFLEANTRIQVEHTVTEAITGIDVVKWQLRVAAGEELDFPQDAVDVRGHAVEYRINAEHPDDDFSPATGTLETYDPPGGIGVRLDDALRTGDEITGEYDSMVAKLIVEGSDREECLARSERALQEFRIEGLPTVIPFHLLMLTDEQFLTGTHTTDYLDEELDPERIEQAVDRWGGEHAEADEAEDGAVEREFTIEVNGKRFEVDLEEHGTTLPADPVDGEAVAGAGGPESGGGAAATPAAEAGGGDAGGAAVEGEGERVTAEMQGTVLSVDVAEGDEVAPGDVVCVLEAMKMENDVIAERGGTVTEVAVDEGESVDMGDALIVLE